MDYRNPSFNNSLRVVIFTESSDTTFLSSLQSYDLFYKKTNILCFFLKKERNLLVFSLF